MPPIYIVKIMISLPAAGSMGVSPLVSPTVAPAEVTSYRILIRYAPSAIPSVTMASATVEVSTTPSPSMTIPRLS